MTLRPFRGASGQTLTSREELATLADVVGDIAGRVTLLALPIVVLAPGLLAIFALTIPFLIPVIVLAIAGAVLAIPVLLGRAALGAILSVWSRSTRSANSR